jgi:hypothetical protein
MTAPVVIHTEYEAREIAEGFGIGPYWRALLAEMVKCGAWTFEEVKA